MPTHVYEIVVERFTVEGTDYVSDMTEVNELAGQGYEVIQMLAIGCGSQPGGFVFLMARVVTNVTAAKKKKDA
jgi:hypothetical protein